ncbi:DUF4129 domain-containing protein [Microbacterium chocolatum]|uniref:DUF4129 domain-containing protein n=1 Tax=Microbacterium aurantiacum TaxID=162393 RepID=UPI00338E0F89
MRTPLIPAAVPPLLPDGDEAREWAERELADPAYRIAEPTPLDRAARAVVDFFTDLFSTPLDGGLGPTVALIAAVVAVLLIGAAFAVWGMPRRRPRAPAAPTILFGEREDRSADDLRRAAEERARAEDFDAAMILRFRALARACLERGVVDLPPGATVHAFARAAAASFPASRDGLDRAADDFDDVRYLRKPGSAAAYRRVSDVDDEVRRATPRVAAAVPA